MKEDLGAQEAALEAVLHKGQAGHEDDGKHKRDDDSRSGHRLQDDAPGAGEVTQGVVKWVEVRDIAWWGTLGSRQEEEAQAQAHQHGPVCRHPGSQARLQLGPGMHHRPGSNTALEPTPTPGRAVAAVGGTRRAGPGPALARMAGPGQVLGACLSLEPQLW